MRAYIILNEGYPTLVGGLALVLNETFRNMEINATADWYFDDDVEDGTEYGVKVEVTGISQSEWNGLLTAINDFCTEQYGHQVRVEVSLPLPLKGGSLVLLASARKQRFTLLHSITVRLF